MAKVKISELSEINEIIDAFAPVEQNGKNGKVNLSKIRPFVLAENDGIFAGNKTLPKDIVNLVKGSSGSKAPIIATAAFGGWNGIGMVIRNSNTYTYTQITADSPGILSVRSANYDATGMMLGDVKAFSIEFNGDGTKALMNDGTYKDFPAAKEAPRLLEYQNIQVSDMPAAGEGPILSLQKSSKRLGMKPAFTGRRFYLFRLKPGGAKNTSNCNYTSSSGWKPVYEEDIASRENRIWATFVVSATPAFDDSYLMHEPKEDKCFMHSIELENGYSYEETTIPSGTCLEQFVIQRFVNCESIKKQDDEFNASFTGSHARPLETTGTPRIIRQWFGLSESQDGSGMLKFCVTLSTLSVSTRRGVIAHGISGKKISLGFHARG